MKLFVISDIHGSYNCLKKALDAYKKEKGDLILILGDELYHGPRNPIPESYDPKSVANILNDYKEKIIAFGVGLAPASIHMKYIDLENVNIDSKQGPSLVSACVLCSSLISTEILKIAVKRKEIKAAPHYCQFDPYLQKYKKGYLTWGNRNPIQKLKRWYLLKRFSK